MSMPPKDINPTWLWGSPAFTLEEIKKMTHKLLSYELPPFKHRKLTYKTLRHDCAKRNGRR